MSRAAGEAGGGAAAAGSPASSEGTRRNMSSGRETAESFVVVFMIFLVLSVEAEGFVIPTGSMAPTLMGRHKEVTCPECGHVYAVNADREVNPDGSASPESRRIVAGVCDNCRFPARIDDEPNFQGDRIYVMKTPLNLPVWPGLGTARLGRWDVAVFKLPEEPEVRYIKRMVGLPGETVRINRGDLWVRPLGSEAEFERPARPLRHLDAMQILVHDDAYRPKSLAADPRWVRWRRGDDGGWKESPTGTYRAQTGGGSDWTELRYHNVVPDPVQWAAVAQGKPVAHPPRATLVTDFYAYNTDLTAEMGQHPSGASKAWRQPHWVGDLSLRGTLDVANARGRVRFELVKGGIANRCEVDLANGNATLHHGDELIAGPVPTPVVRPGRYPFQFANVDGRLSARLGGVAVFGDGVGYPEPEVPEPAEADLRPAAVAASDGADVTVSGLVLSRDIYYTLDPARADHDDADLADPLPTDPVALFDWLADPSRFAVFARFGRRDFPIAPGRYLMLGDNSPWSRDGRAWQRTDQIDPGDPTRGWDDSGRERWEVPESLLIGKAFCVYWPHLKPFGPTFRVGRDFRLPSRPYFEKMRWIR